MTRILTAAALLTLAFSAHAADPERWKDPKPNLPDLSVRFIQREPRFKGTKVDWINLDEPNGNKGNPASSPIVNAKEQKWPKKGQEVTFTAHVRNAGPVATPRFDWYWVIDGKDVTGPAGNGWAESLAPGEEKSFTIPWKWKTGRHWVAFETNRGRKFDEITFKNNALCDATDALSFAFFVQPQLYDWFAGVKSGFDSYSWDDWAQYQVAEMNRTFRDEIHPATPNGIEVRVRIDRIEFLPRDFNDPGGMHTPEGENNVEGGNDGVWGFTVGYLEKDKDGKNVYERLPHWITGVEWSLLHELGHQLGQPDYYLLPVSAKNNGALPGVGYNPPKWFQDQMMFSGNYAHDSNVGQAKGVWDSGYRFWEEAAARAFNREPTMRRGFFGNFLTDVPASCTFVVLGDDNKPLVDAKVALHVAISREYGNARFDAQPDFTGATDTVGKWTLNRSPWRVIMNWTSNGAVQFVVTPKEGEQRVGFLNICDFNLAYWRGHTKNATLYVVTRKVSEVRR